jgi:hypothetical protein
MTNAVFTAMHDGEPVAVERYLQPAAASGNPVLSIKQTDIVYHGADLPHY